MMTFREAAEIEKKLKKGEEVSSEKIKEYKLKNKELIQLLFGPDIGATLMKLDNMAMELMNKG